MLPEARCELEHRVVGNVRRDVFVSLLLIADVNKAVVHTHFEFGRALIPPPLVFVKFFKTLQRCEHVRVVRARPDLREAYCS